MSTAPLRRVEDAVSPGAETAPAVAGTKHRLAEVLEAPPRTRPKGPDASAPRAGKPRLRARLAGWVERQGVATLLAACSITKMPIHLSLTAARNIRSSIS